MMILKGIILGAILLAGMAVLFVVVTLGMFLSKMEKYEP